MTTRISGRLLLTASLLAAPVSAQVTTVAPTLTVDRIYRDAEFTSAPMPGIVWMADGQSWVEMRTTAGGTDFVKVDAATGSATTLARGVAIRADTSRAVAVESFSMTRDQAQALLYHSTERVWRRNTRGLYHVLDVRTGALRAVSELAGHQMFAKLSPDGRRVAFVRANDLFVTDLATGRETRLTTDGSGTIINGTTDWVYEEEFGLADAFRWSPDGRRIAFWRFDQSPVPEFPIVDELQLYPRVAPLRYPKAGQPNSFVRLGVIDLEGGNRTTWLDVGQGNDQYLPRMEWLGTDSLVVQRLPRRQNRLDLLFVSATTGGARTVFTETDTAYVDVEHGALHWVNGERQFLWLSDRSGWRQIFLYDRRGNVVRQVTRDGMDVLGIIGYDERSRQVYFTAAAPTPTQRNVYRVSIDGRGGPTRVTPQDGTHSFSLAPGAAWAVGIHSSLNSPARATLYEMPAMRPRRTLQDNATLRGRLVNESLRPAEFIRVPMADGTVLDGWRFAPVDFDSTRRHPVLMFAYGGPAAPSVNDAFSGNNYMWWQMLAQHGYVVISVDNRGAAWRGRDFRKVTQHRLGIHESDDQIEVARWLGRQSWADSSRIGIWGWSYGGYLALMTAARGGPLFRMTMAVAPVTDWRFYDTIYTERYMWVPQENREGYDLASPLTHIDGLTANLLLVHGTGDDNVHAQNSLVLADRLAVAGKRFYMMMYPNRTHSISERGVAPQLRATLTRFILENL
jgi:dipeptidyl-peptidase 4